MANKRSYNEAFPIRDHVGGDVINTGRMIKVNNLYGNINVGEGSNQPSDDYYKSFLTSLEQKGKEACSFKGVLEELKKVRIAPLQITEHVERHYTDDVDHYIHRDELVRLISNPPIGDISYEDLFEAARTFAQSKIKTFLNQEAKLNQLDIKGNIAAISGQAGIGKTTLTKVILDKVIETRLYGSQIVFYLPFRNIDYKKKTSLLQLLAKSVDCSWMKNEEICNAVMEKLLNQSEKVLIIMDGLDEADIKWDSIPSTKVDIYQEDKPEMFIANILNGNILPKAKKLLTSRPRQLSELPDWLTPRFSVKILGLNKDAQKQICDDLCKNNSQKVFDHIQNHPDLSSYCFVPVNCILVIHCVNQIMMLSTRSSTKLSLPTSMTMVLTSVLCNFIRTEQMRQSKLQTKELSNLAWQGFSVKKLTFNEDDLNQADLDKNTLNTFLVTIRGESELPLLVGDFESVSYFSHLLLQEYFVALNLLFFINFEKFNSLFFESSDGRFQFNLNESRFEMVLKFLFGLCNATSVKYLQKGVSTCSFPSQQAEKLKDLARHNLDRLGDLTDQKDKFKLVLHICSLAYEMNTEFTEEVASLITNHLSVEGDILSSDVTCLFYVLKAGKELLKMVIKFKKNFHGDSFARFFEELNKTLEFRKIEVTMFDIFNTCIGDVEATNFSSCLKIVKSIKFSECTLSKNGFAEISNGIENLNEPMESVDFNQTKIGDGGARHLSTCLKNIKELHLSDCGVTLRGMKKIAVEIGNLQTPMKRFALTYRRRADKTVICLASVVRNIQELVLCKCDISAESIKHLSEEMSKLEKPMKFLNLSGNKIRDEGGIHLKKIVNNVESLNLHNCKLTGVTVENIAKNLNNPMKFLDLSGNEIGDEGGIHLKKIVNNVEGLNLHICNLTGVTVENIAKNLKNPMKFLDLSYNKIGDEGGIHLVKIVNNVESLGLRWCSLTGETVKNIATNLKNQMKLLNLSNNKIEDEGGIHLKEIVNNVESLNLDNCDLTGVTVESIARSLKNPMKCLDLKSNKIGNTGFIAISPCLSKISELYIGDENDESLTMEGINSLSSALQGLETPMEKLRVYCPRSIYEEVEKEMQKFQSNVKDYNVFS